MDPSTVFERADVRQEPGDLLPGGTGDRRWVAVDPDTACRGVGTFEEAARTNLVYAVRAYESDPDSATPYMSSGQSQTAKMHWLDETETTLTDRFLSRLPF